MIRAFNRITLGLTRSARNPLPEDSWQREQGQRFVEYARLITFNAVVALVAVKLLGANVSSLVNSVANSFERAPGRVVRADAAPGGNMQSAPAV